MGVAVAIALFWSNKLFIFYLFIYKNTDGDGFRSETTTWTQKWFKNPLGLLESSKHDRFSRRRRRAWLYCRNIYKIAGGSILDVCRNVGH
jgi:hypothetical protein